MLTLDLSFFAQPRFILFFALSIGASPHKNVTGKGNKIKSRSQVREFCRAYYSFMRGAPATSSPPPSPQPYHHAAARQRTARVPRWMPAPPAARHYSLRWFLPALTGYLRRRDQHTLPAALVKGQRSTRPMAGKMASPGVYSPVILSFVSQRPA